MRTRKRLDGRSKTYDLVRHFIADRRRPVVTPSDTAATATSPRITPNSSPTPTAPPPRGAQIATVLRTARQTAQERYGQPVVAELSVGGVILRMEVDAKATMTTEGLP
ncbi:hypothetical protein [Blastococcus sp. TF02A-26]|uniref:hypothetical protein n=1 Tax=Blastococcus sp. TF02A-26 TaxID=2250577 RepID=UPI0011BD4613|nr:hypothetical protein [Blastococcus sp. TF02A-26]